MAKVIKSAILSVYDENGNKIPIPALQAESSAAQTMSNEDCYSIKSSQIYDSKGFNWIDNRYLKNGYLDNNGEIINSTDNRKFVTISVTPNQIFVLCGKNNSVNLPEKIRITKSDGSFSLVKFDSVNNLKFLKLKSIVIPENVVSVEFNNQENLRVGFTDSLINAVYYYYGCKNIFADEFDKAYVTECDNLFDKKMITHNCMITSTGGIILNQSDEKGIGSFLCKANTLYYIGFPSINAPVWGGKCIKISERASEILDQTLLEDGYSINLNDAIIPTKKFLFNEDQIICFNAGSGNNVAISVNANKDDYKIYNAIKKINGKEIKSPDSFIKHQKLISVLDKKKVAFIGDSITVGVRTKKRWSDYIRDWTGIIVQNVAVSGSGFSTLSNSYITKIPLLEADSDLICVAMSWNDLSRNLPSGEISDTGTTSLAGYANAFFDEIISTFPETPIICVCQGPWENNRYGKGSDKWNETLREICKLHGIPYYDDLYSNGSILKPWIEANKTKYYTSDGAQQGLDGIHPNSFGHRVIARRLLPHFFENIVSENANEYLIL